MENLGICLFTHIPMRSQASDKSEMVSQLLFGETYKVLDNKSKWLLIQLHSDGYEGWIDSSQHQVLPEEKWHSYNQDTSLILNNLTANIRTKNNGNRILSFGSVFKNSITEIFPDFFGEISTEDFVAMPTNFDADKMTAAATKLEGTTYLWGGKSAFGIDCSGFTQICAKAAGYQLFRDASQQAGQGKIIDFLEEAQTGDLAFFDNEESQIVHVGIILSPGKIIHASGCVHIDSLDHHGIFNKGQNKYTHKLRLIKTLRP